MLDSDISTYAQHPENQFYKPVTEQLKKLDPGQAVISVITLGELRYGIENAPFPEEILRALNEFLTVVTTLSLPKTCAQIYADTLGHLVKLSKERYNIPNLQIKDFKLRHNLNDIWIASHAIASNCMLITNNVKDFQDIPKLKFANWAKP
ncbi:MAG: type II toxin-antitoxin system VapC family toxin [Deltaproteobacteria bacterium]|jgi:tRNA(fMet)-specific endonuclease VapC|nr:type II toxin-antitoxin system VapC family toxin [Deltaproteobacteria bacterium]